VHNNYYFLRQLTPVLQARLPGYRLASAFSQEKDELVLEFARGQETFYIKAILSPAFTALSFPDNFNRARANSASLFPEITGKAVLDVVQHENERSFHLVLEDGYALLFKMFGNRSNVVLFQGDEARALFQNKFDKDLALRLSAMGRRAQADKSLLLEVPPAPLARLYPTFGDLPAAYLQSLGYGTAPPARQWELLEHTRQLLENPVYSLTRVAGRTRLSLLPLGEVRETYTQPLEALQAFVGLYLRETSFEKNYQQLYQQLHKKLNGGKKFLEEVEYKMLELEYDESYSQTADLIMANLTNIRPQAREVEVFDFYHNQNILLKLPEKQSPQKYAERLYQKNKNRRIELRFLQERAQAKKSEIAQLEALARQLAGITDSRELRQFQKNNAFLSAGKQDEPASPFRLFETEGFKILVGKSARNNDQLTQQHTFKEDLWLHAKDVAGSHVVVKYQAGKSFPETVIEKAAQLAAWYSKRKNDSLCPVLYTPKKYVRKPKGAGPGAVFVEREKVILVKPDNPFSNS
jgi:predicted ribosome quality control (RQC) complex YloA/Tae2 family protein